MNSPAERYAAARQRAKFPTVTEFAQSYPFPLDEFQVRACEALEEGFGVLVCAPTGAGKTVVGEFAVHIALNTGRKCFYTTPIKALSNQKYLDLVRRHGADKVGLLTGDNAINGDAPIVVMTTEVLRNMLYAGSPALSGLGYVVMDEVHYLADRFRGAVWEEVIIHLPQAVTLVSLSATVSNAEEFAEWLVTVRGHTKVIVTEHRPVPLSQHMLVGTRLFDLFKDSHDHRVSPTLIRHVRDREHRFASSRRSRGRPYRPPLRADVISRLDAEGLLPAITFIFSRNGCDDAVRQCVHAGLRLNTPEDREQIRELVDPRMADLAPEDLQALGYWEWLDALERGIAAHHAGLIPPFKEAIEDLFVRGLVKAVFATETLALGINMPARSVVLERLIKWNGQTHVDITPGEYTQLTGRAGRRGIDVEGHAVVLWSPDNEPSQVAGLASTRTYPLRSSFVPSYNMAVNLVGQFGRPEARQLLESSFAQFQADRSVVGLAQQVQRNTEALEGYAQAMMCDRGEFAEYAELRVQLKNRETAQARQGAADRRAAAAQSLETLRIGDVIRIPSGRRAGIAVVLDPGQDPLSEPRPLVLTQARWAGRLSLVDFPRPVEPLGRVRVPPHFNHRSPQARRDLASSLRFASIAEEKPKSQGKREGKREDSEIADLRAAIRQHPCHSCPDREHHARWAERHYRLRRDTDKLQRRVEGKTHSIARTFDRVYALLNERGYLVGDTVTPAGRQLGRIWSESDLLVAECLRNGVWDDLSPAELAAVASAALYESRRDHEVLTTPPARLQNALAEMVNIWSDISQSEAAHQLEQTKEPDFGFVWAAYRWARGESLDQVLTNATDAGQELSAGDFVRWCKQLLDLLEQLSKLNDDTGFDVGAIRATAKAACDVLRRGVVAYSGVN